MNTLFSVIALAILAVTFVSALGPWWGIAAHSPSSWSSRS